MQRLTPARLREIRERLELSRPRFGRILWAAETTVAQWESGECAPVGAHRRLLELMLSASDNSEFKLRIKTMRSVDALFLVYSLLRPLYTNETDLESGIPMHRISIRPISPVEVRTIRKAMGLTQEEFARFLWITYSTLNRWEAGRAAPFGMALQILILLQRKLKSKEFHRCLQNPKFRDFTFLLYQLLECSYVCSKAKKTAGRPRGVRKNEPIS